MGLGLPCASHHTFGYRKDELRVNRLVPAVTLVEPAD